jgi:hypothetical protein
MLTAGMGSHQRDLGRCHAMGKFGLDLPCDSLQKFSENLAQNDSQVCAIV